MSYPHLTRQIPARTKVVQFTWVVKSFTTMSQTYRTIRAKARNKMISCFWCGHKFEDGESIALAAREKACNVTLCHGCADAALEKAEGSDAN